MADTYKHQKPWQITKYDAQTTRRRLEEKEDPCLGFCYIPFCSDDVFCGIIFANARYLIVTESFSKNPLCCLTTFVLKVRYLLRYRFFYSAVSIENSQVSNLQGQSSHSRHARCIEIVLKYIYLKKHIFQILNILWSTADGTTQRLMLLFIRLLEVLFQVHVMGKNVHKSNRFLVFYHMPNSFIFFFVEGLY